MYTLLEGLNVSDLGFRVLGVQGLGFRGLGFRNVTDSRELRGTRLKRQLEGETLGIEPKCKPGIEV